MPAKVKINDIQVSIYQNAVLTDMKVVFVHGYPFSKEMWIPQLKALTFWSQAVAYDIRGFGQSESGAEEFSIDLFSNDLIDLMDFMKFTKAVVVGFSMGGYIVLRAYEKAPERFRGLVLCDTRAGGVPNPGTRSARYEEIAQINDEIGYQAFGENFLKKIFTPAGFETKKAEIEQIRSVILKTPKEILLKGETAIMSRKDQTDLLSKIKVPTLILVGEKDELTPPSQSQEMKEKIPNAQIQIIPDAGHLSNLENPTEFNKQLIQFVSNL